MALHFACYHNAFECIEYLLSTDEGRSSVNVYDHPLHYNTSDQSKICRLVSHRGVHEDLKYFDVSSGACRTLLLSVIVNFFILKIRIRSVPAIVQLLINAGASVNKIYSDDHIDDLKGPNRTLFVHLISKV